MTCRASMFPQNLMDSVKIHEFYKLNAHELNTEHLPHLMPSVEPAAKGSTVQYRPTPLLKGPPEQFPRELVGRRGLKSPGSIRPRRARPNIRGGKPRDHLSVPCENADDRRLRLSSKPTLRRAQSVQEIEYRFALSCAVLPISWFRQTTRITREVRLWS